MAIVCHRVYGSRDQRISWLHEGCSHRGLKLCYFCTHWFSKSLFFDYWLVICLALKYLTDSIIPKWIYKAIVWNLLYSVTESNNKWIMKETNHLSKPIYEMHACNTRHYTKIRYHWRVMLLARRGLGLELGNEGKSRADSFSSCSDDSVDSWLR